MLHAEDLERFRRMTPEARLKSFFYLCDMAWSFLERLPPDERRRRIELSRRLSRPLPPEKSGS